MKNFVKSRSYSRLVMSIVERLLGRIGYRVVRRTEVREVRPLERSCSGVLPAMYRLKPVTMVVEPIVIEIDIEHCRDSYGFGFGADGWHPFVQAIRSYLENGEMNYNGSFLEKYYSVFQPRSAAEALGVLESESLRQVSPLEWVQPWTNESPSAAGDRRRKIIRQESRNHGFYRMLDANDGFMLFGPVSRALGEFEWARLVRSYESIASKGYDRSMLEEDITVKVLRKGDEERYVVITGRHRLAALTVLGYERVPVRLVLTPMPVINTADMTWWPHVEDGLYSREAAVKYVDSLFNDNGYERAASIGLVGWGSGPRTALGSFKDNVV